MGFFNVFFITYLLQSEDGLKSPQILPTPLQLRIGAYPLDAVRGNTYPKSLGLVGIQSFAVGPVKFYYIDRDHFRGFFYGLFCRLNVIGC